MTATISAATTKPDRQGFLWMVIFGFFTTIGLLQFCYRYLDDVTRCIPGTFSTRMIEEMTGAYTGAVLFPVFVWAARRFRISKTTYYFSLPAHVLVAVGTSGAHTSLMALTRRGLFWLFGLGTYDYGIMSIRYLMEFPNDLIWYAAIVGFIHLFDRYQVLRERETRAAQLEAQLAQAQLQSLQLQIQPHFLFNALNTISATLYEDLTAADRMIARLSDFLRLTLQTAHHREVPLGEELHFLELYLDIMKARFETALEVVFDIQPETHRAQVPRFLLQPLVENALKYAVDPQAGKVRIEIRARHNRDRLELEVCDCGPGLTSETETTATSKIGWANLRERLAVLYPDQFSFTIANQSQGGLRTAIAIPWNVAESELANVGTARAHR
ncbi:MAG: histidine kinase [Blastocatellia bacterium]|nr:histidine kinase [Blastocatellia bacterium]